MPAVARAGLSARARPLSASCKPTANNAASAARRAGWNTRDSLMPGVLRRRRLGLLAFGHDAIGVFACEEIRKILVLRIVHLVDAAEEFEQVFVRLGLLWIAHDSNSPAAHS